MEAAGYAQPNSIFIILVTMSVKLSVRLAMPAEAAAVARLQAATLRKQLGEIALPDLGQATDAWLSAITRPPLATYRVLVALADDEVAGYALTGPSDDEDAEVTTGMIGDLVVQIPGQGHGSRLMQACVDTLRADGFEYATMWLLTTDDLLRAFVLSSGWAADGAHRELGGEGSDVASVRQVRLITAL